MNQLDFIEKAADIAYKALDVAKDDFSRLPIHYSAFLRVFTAQGVIDNGGWKYFYERDWPGNPPYREFIDAFAELKCFDSAKALDATAKSFPFENPHLLGAKRREYMSKNYDKKTLLVKGWPPNVFSHHGVFDLMEQYVKANTAHFPLCDNR